MVPSGAVTAMLIAVVVPSASAIGAETVPDVSTVPFTFMVAVASVTVGVIFIVAVAFGTIAV